MLKPSYSFNLNKPIIPGFVAAGKFDGENTSIAAVTAADKIFVYSPQQTLSGGGRFVPVPQSNLSLININQTISSLAAGRLHPEHQSDALLVGTPTSLLAYNILQNTDLFYKEVNDGANCSLIGFLGNRTYPMALIGGNCSLQGFDHTGKDCFWTVTGDVVTSLAVLDFNQDGYPELVVGSEDFDLRVFKEDEIIFELTETESITGLTPLGEDCFGYALANGTVGVYKGPERIWRIKSKNKANAIFSFDLDGDGVPELITGWSNGKVDARNARTGEVIFKDNLPHPVAGIVQADLARSGRDQLIVCTTQGELRGFSPKSGDQSMDLMGSNFEQDSIHELSLKKQNLLLELRNYEENLKFSHQEDALKKLAQPGGANQEFGVIPASTQLRTHLEVNTESESHHVELVLQTTNNTIIKAVIIFAEGIFEGESHVVHLPEKHISNILKIPLYPPKDMPIDLHIKALIGYPAGLHYHVFEVNRPLPKFAMYTLCENTEDLAAMTHPPGRVTFTLPPGVSCYKVRSWINTSFLMPLELPLLEDSVDLWFLSLRSGQPLKILAKTNGQMELGTENMELAGELIQSLATSLELEHMATLAEFPESMEQLVTLMAQVKELQETREKLFTDMADNTDLIKSLIVRAEDARLLGDLDAMEYWYQELSGLNREMVNTYKIRSGNYNQLLESLRRVSQMIQCAGNLRVGRYKSQVVGDCRLAIKNLQTNLLPRIISGDEIAEI